MFRINNIFPEELFPRGLHPENEEEDVSYDFFLGSYVQHLDECKRYYWNDHPNPPILQLDSGPSSLP